MYRAIRKQTLSPDIIEFEVEAPLIAAKARPGHFVLVRSDEKAERIPLTIADSDPDKGTITLVVQVIGEGTRKLAQIEEGETFLGVVGPLGKHRDPHGPGKTVCCVSGGLGLAPMFPQTKAHHEAGNRVISIIGARTQAAFFWQDRVAEISDRVLYATDDGSFGHKGFATQLLDQVVAEGETIDEVIAIGPVPHMRAVAECCKRHNLPVVVSLNPIMVDGTGMCGGCRVTVGNETKYACVDGPEFDGALVDFEELMARQKTYNETKANPLEEHECHLDEHVHNMLGNFNEVARVMTDEEALAEAERCLLCKKPRCVLGCPVEVRIPEFIEAIRNRDLPMAARLLKDKNSLPAICGRVCPQETQCEAQCVLGVKQTPVRIGALERYVADWEAAHELVVPEKAPSKNKKVAIVGSGPGGLTCAGDLAKRGYDVTIFEAFHATGGVLRYGIPEFRLPKSIVDREVDYIKSLGVEVKLDVVIGKTFTVEELKSHGFEAIFIAVGAGAPVFMGMEGENLVGVYSANEFLTRVNLMKAYLPDYDTPVEVGREVVVIGGGNVAMDAARTALRLGARSVTIVYRRTEKEMPARLEEVQHAKEEGVQFFFQANPVKIEGNGNGRVRAMRCVRMEMGEPDASGRRRPVPVPDSEFEMECDMVIPAIGTSANPLLTTSTDGLELNKWGNICVDEETGATSIPGVFAGGDIVSGAATVIEAMGAGRRAADGIDAYLSPKN